MKTPDGPDPDMLDEYDFGNARRRRYAQRSAAVTNVVLLDPDVVPVLKSKQTDILRFGQGSNGGAEPPSFFALLDGQLQEILEVFEVREKEAPPVAEFDEASA